VARAVFDDLVTTFFPGDCRACGGVLLKAGSSPVCDECIDGLRAQSAALCVRCGEALDLDGLDYERQFGAEALLCSPCRLAPPEFERAQAWGLYEDRMRELIHLLKYEHVRSVAKPLGRLLARVMAAMAAEGMPREAVVIAVPLFGAKKRQRGYNQSELLAEEALAELGQSGEAWRLTSAHRALCRVRDTESQFELSASGRRRNLKGAFAVADPPAVAGREVLLVDDIFTSGATARECARVLMQAGAARVWVATVSRAQREMVASWEMQAGTRDERAGART
jgi:ComF family protein